nr:MAG TPA: hypothetical protein [Caudoviricetes sp.]
MLPTAQPWNLWFRSRHYSFTGQCLSAPVVFGFSAPPSSPTAPLRSCSLADYLGLVVIVPVKVLGLPANQLTAYNCLLLCACQVVRFPYC